MWNKRSPRYTRLKQILYKQFRGITLTELLVALGILGVISVFMVPKVIQAHQEGQKEAVFSEAEEVVTKVIRRGMAEGVDQEKRILHFDTLRDYLFDIDFPVSKSELMQAYGNSEIHWTSRETLALEDILHDIHQTRFNTMDELIGAIRSVIQLAFRDTSVTNQQTLFED